ncbi:hypothetical protein BDB00DRAFT_917866, partial [Zychaea mexicana]|uniref:uncharacterized protein n=1 Tax=Zychaea mexicana TaxID=64656 RepID=UPI0022FED82A
RYHLRKETEKALDKSATAAAALKDLDKLQRQHNNRKTLPKGILDIIQKSILRNHPRLQVAVSWFANRLNSYKSFDRINTYKEEGNQLFEEVRQYLQISSWDDILGYDAKSSSGDRGSGSGSGSGNKGYEEGKDGDDNDEEEEEEAIEGDSDNKTTKLHETITFSLRAILRDEIDYELFLQTILSEQDRVGRCLHQLSSATELLTSLIASGEAARHCGIPTQQVAFDFKTLVPRFDFKKHSPQDSPTAVNVTYIPADIDALQAARIYTFEHFSNLLSGCVGSSVRENKEAPVFKDIRAAIAESGHVTKQDDFLFNGAMNNGLREFVTSAHNLWTRKRHDRDLRVVSTLLLRAILAPKRLSAFLEKRSQYFELKKAAKEQNNAQAETKAPVSKKHAIDTMHYYIKELTWAIVRERNKEVTDKLLLKTQEWKAKVDSFPSSSTGANKERDSIKKTQKVTRSLRSAVQQSNPLKVCTADEQQEDDEAATSEDAETSTRKIRALVSIIKRLLDKATEDVSAQTIKDAAFQGTNLAHSECKAAAHICNALRPYYMPEASDEDDDDDTDDKDSLTIHQCAPLAYITNTAVALIGPQQNQWATFPSVDEKDQSLHISTDVLYTLFSGDFKIPAETPKGEITSKREAVDWRRKRDVFGAFFKLPKIQQAMESKKLTLAYRVTFVNRHTVRVLGTRTVTTGVSCVIKYTTAN